MRSSELIKANEAAQIIDVSLQTLYRMTWRGEFTRVPYGKQWRWRRSELEAYKSEGAKPAEVAQ